MKTFAILNMLLIFTAFSAEVYAEDMNSNMKMDHSKHQEMSAMDMKNMDMKDTKTNHEDMDESSMKMDHSKHQGMSNMDMDDMNMKGMDMSGMQMDHMNNMSLDAEGMVMNSNDSKLPQDCQAINKEYNITVHAGTKYSKGFPGSIFGMDKHKIHVEPCSLIHVTFINEDQIRHQWMVHGLPKYLYDKGMFHLEATGGAQKSGSFIVPSDNKTYLIHCDIAQHMEKGMKAELIVGKGSGDLFSVPGISGAWLNPN